MQRSSAGVAGRRRSRLPASNCTHAPAYGGHGGSVQGLNQPSPLSRLCCTCLASPSFFWCDAEIVTTESIQFASSPGYINILLFALQKKIPNPWKSFQWVSCVLISVNTLLSAILQAEMSISSDVEDWDVELSHIEEPESNKTQGFPTDARLIAKPRAILNREQAIEIFQLRPSENTVGTGRSSLAVARTYKVSEKTVRDIWRGRTWHHETLHLDPSRPARADTPPGRPLGRKDSAPRRRPVPSLSAIAKLPAAEVADDPFHDDWPNWHRADRSSEMQLQRSVPVAMPVSKEASKCNQDLARIEYAGNLQLQAISLQESALITTPFKEELMPLLFADGDAWLDRRQESSWPSPAHAGAGAGGWPSARTSMPPGAAASGQVEAALRTDTRDHPPGCSGTHSAAEEPHRSRAPAGHEGPPSLLLCSLLGRAGVASPRRCRCRAPAPRRLESALARRRFGRGAAAPAAAPPASLAAAGRGSESCRPAQDPAGALLLRDALPCCRPRRAWTRRRPGPRRAARRRPRPMDPARPRTGTLSAC